MKSHNSLCLFFTVLASWCVMVPSVTAQFVQQGGKLVGTGSTGAAAQGSSVSISGDGNIAIVGGYNDNSGTGAVWVYTRSGGIWNQQGNKLVGASAAGVSGQGNSVSLSSDGTTAIVGGTYDNGSAGAAWVFSRSSGVWKQQGNKLVGTGAVGIAYQDNSVSISADGNTAIEGGNNDNNGVGAAWVFVRTDTIWGQWGDALRNKLVGTGAVNGTNGAQQGVSVAISGDGNTAIVGGDNDNNGVGAAWVWTRSGNVWTQQGGKLVGSGLVGIAHQGYSVSLSSTGNTAIVGGYADSSGVGAAWIFSRSGGAWTQQGNKLVGSSHAGHSNQGSCVSLSDDGNKAIVGGRGDSSGLGAAWVWTRSGNVWTQQGSKLVGTGNARPSYQGSSVSLSSDGRTVIVGGWGDSLDVGASWVFHNPDLILSDSVNGMWNLVSVPLTVSNYSKSVLFPAATSTAFTYEHGYVGYATLESGRGYWVKFSSAQSVSIAGLERTGDTVNVSSGWNMIGSLSSSIPVSSIGSIPGGIFTSSFFGYNGSAYFIAASILPARGYWVKASQAGKLVLNSTGNAPSAARIRIEDTGEQPPSAPDRVGSVVPVVYELGQNFPNPFNPTTTITYTLPASGHVMLTVYNMLGQEVATLANEHQDAGYKSVSFDASRLPSGMYTYRITAGTFTDVKKMVLIK